MWYSESILDHFPNYDLVIEFSNQSIQLYNIDLKCTEGIWVYEYLHKDKGFEYMSMNAKMLDDM